MNTSSILLVDSTKRGEVQLIPYAEKWGIRDKEPQDRLLHKASLVEIEELYAILYPAWDDIDKFIRSHLSADELGSYEAEIFNALRPVLEETSFILLKEQPGKWLRIIGWPERFPGPKLDPAKFPAELRPLIPYAEKWVLEDEGVRDIVISVATNEELEELVTAVNQVGDQVIRDLAFKINAEDETRWKDSYVLLILLQLAEQAEFLLRSRRDSKSTDDDQPE